MVATNGDLTNVGGLLQGETRNINDPDSKGAATLTASGSVIMRSESADRLAIAFGNSDDLVVTAGADVTNIAGRFLSNKHTTINAAGTFTNGVERVEGTTPTGQVQTSATAKGGHWWQLWRRTHRTSYVLDYGTLTVPGQLAYVVGTGVTINAAHVVNRGGEINANDGVVKINTETLINEAVIAGSAHLDEKCWLVCSATGSSNMTSNGGTINASKTIEINATGAVTNIGGQWLGLDGVNISAGSLDVAGIQLVSIAQRPGGLSRLFKGSTAWATTSDSGGLILSPKGTIQINTPTAVTVTAGAITGGTVVAPAGITVVRAPVSTSNVKDHTLGVLSGWR